MNPKKHGISHWGIYESSGIVGGQIIEILLLAVKIMN
jgi:hypothetical protein